MNGEKKASGYLHPDYARSLAEFGDPRHLESCDGWILTRQIPDFDGKDAMGCYPLFVCGDWKKIGSDLNSLDEDLVSLVLVSDPFAGADELFFREHFDIVRPFKEHLLVRLDAEPEEIISKKHRYNARHSLRDMNVEIITRPETMLEEWNELYQNLIARHRITGIQAFSKKSFETQLGLPGLRMVAGRLKSTDQIVGIQLMIMQDANAYSHLAAYSLEGYRISAAYGIYLEALKYLWQNGIRYFDLGSVAGNEEKSQDGLAFFKKGWSNDRCPVYLCGKILDHEKYERACKANGAAASDYFPAYRAKK